VTASPSEVIVSPVSRPLAAQIRRESEHVGTTDALVCRWLASQHALAQGDCSEED